MRKIALISDIHFGDPKSSLSSVAGQNNLIEMLKNESPFNEIILLGDILELNTSTLYFAIEGTPEVLSKTGKKLEGFRSFLHRLLVEQDVKVNSIIYVPGNHDYFIFQQEALYMSVMNKLKKGAKLSGKPMLFLRSENSFIGGIMPKEKNIKFVLSYPNYVIRVEKGKHILWGRIGDVHQYIS
jgi:UDP-2,3-diacylglucosamine pyrophosphatase LpxH